MMVEFMGFIPPIGVSLDIAVPSLGPPLLSESCSPALPEESRWPVVASGERWWLGTGRLDMDCHYRPPRGRILPRLGGRGGRGLHRADSQSVMAHQQL